MNVLVLCIVMAVAAGFTLPTQAGINARLAVDLGSAVRASAVSFLVGTVTLLLYLWLTPGSWPRLGTVLRLAPWWAWIGGCLGAFFVAAVTFLAPRLGAATMVGLVVAGQMGASIVLDHLGVLGYPHHPVSLGRVLGIVLILAGVYLIRVR